SGSERRSATVRLLRPTSFHHSPSPSTATPWPRRPSGTSGCSILTTSAPKSPSTWQVSGPARMVDASITRTPESGPGIESDLLEGLVQLGEEPGVGDVVLQAGGPPVGVGLVVQEHDRRLLREVVRHLGELRLALLARQGPRLG